MKNRRTLLAGLAMSGLMLGRVSSSTIAAAPRPSDSRPSLGFSLYGMKSFSLAEAIQICSEIGYQHVELSLNEGFPSHPAVFTSSARQATTSQLTQLGLELPCLMIQLSLVADAKAHAVNLETIRVAGKMARELAPDNPPILETVLGGSPAKWDEQKHGMLIQLHDWAEAAEAGQTNIAIKAHVGSAVSTPERLLWLLDSANFSAIQAAFDFSHFELQGIGLRESLTQLLPKIKFIHVKDAMGNADKFEFRLPGEGRTNYIEYFSLLRELNYNGPVCVEVSSQVFNKPNYQPTAAAKSCYATLSAAMNSAFKT